MRRARSPARPSATPASSSKPTVGTLFLDEVGELPQAAQVKLLRALQEGEVEAVGGRKPIKVDVRIISATNRNLLERAKAGHFREDLFYRLHVLPLTVPPLRTRREDVPHLLRHFLARFRAEENRDIASVDAEALAALATSPGPATSASSRTRSIVPSSSASAVNSGCRISRCSRATMRRHRRRTAEARPRPSGRHRRRRLPATEIPIAPLVTPASLPLLTDRGRGSADRGHRDRGDPIRDHPLSRPNVRGGAPPWNRPFHPLSQARGHRGWRTDWRITRF